MNLKNQQELLSLGKAVIEAEITAISQLFERLDQQFIQACEAILACQGRVIVTGMGKSGHIGNKIAATLASTGTPAFFVHPGEASHGDLGMIVEGDVIIALSNSGTTDEILTLIPILKRLQIILIALTGNPNSLLAEAADFHLNTGVDKEACPLGLAPTSSTTVSLVMGDALAIALLEARGFTPEDFARSHPNGKLGKQLLVHVKDLMHTGKDLPKVLPHTSFKESILEMTSKGLGVIVVVDDRQKLLGIFTDGDLRRAFEEMISFQTIKINQLMIKNCYTIAQEALAVEALNLMQKRSITSLPVVNKEKKLTGIIHMHDLLKANIV